MSLVAELRLHGDLPLFDRTFEAVPGAECTFDDVHYVADEDGGTYYVFFWWLAGADVDAFEAALADDPTARSVRRLATLEDRWLLRVDTRSFPPDQPMVFPQCRKHDVTTIESRRTASGLFLHARFPSRAALDGFVAAASEIASDTEVVRLYSEESVPVEEGLTRKQREAVTLAYERGYFETPSEVTLDALAADLDITPQTLSRHLRVAVKKIVGDAMVEGPRLRDSVFKDSSQ